MSKVIYKPFGLLFGLLGGMLARRLFNGLWPSSDIPEPTREGYSWGQVLSAAATRGAVFAVVKAAVDRGGAIGFERLTGRWPGEKSKPH